MFAEGKAQGELQGQTVFYCEVPGPQVSGGRRKQRMQYPWLTPPLQLVQERTGKLIYSVNTFSLEVRCPTPEHDRDTVDLAYRDMVKGQ